MEDILAALFLDNPCIPEQIYTFCNQLPEFLEAEQNYEASARVLRAKLGKEYDAFEEILNRYLAQYSKAYYLFGLGLRQELLSALERAG